MLKGYRITDVDGHVQEPRDLWERRIDRAFLADVPELRADGRRYYREQERNYKLSAEVLAAFTRRTLETYTEEVQAGWDPASQIRAMDRMGVDVSYLYPTDGLFMWHFRNMDPATANALTRAYNDWLHEFCRYEPARLRPVAAIALQDPLLALGELRRAHAELGMRAVYVRPNPVDGRTLGHPDLEPLWAECERLGAAVGIHEGAHCQLESAGAERFRTDFALWSCSHPMEQMMAFLSLLEAGVLERHPRLRIAFLEAGCGWVPYWLWRLDEQVRGFGRYAPEMKREPSEYFGRQCWVAFEADEEALPALVAHVGEDRIVWGSDYPHHDATFPGAVEKLEAAASRLAPVARDGILGANARRLYRLSAR
jgi:predicted TIM-barrel fold metal-dependent hydrolase